MTFLLWRSPGYGMTLVSESTSGVMHSAESSTQATPTRSPGHGEREEGDKKSAPILPEDIGKQTAMYLIEEIVKVQNEKCQFLCIIFMVCPGWLC